MLLKIKSIHLPIIDSTNTWVKEHLDDLDPEILTCVFADQQTKGRGRFARKWNSPKGVNIYATYYFSLPSTEMRLHNLGQLLSLSAASVLKTYGFHAQIKWPNDLYLSEKKLGGILCEVIKTKGRFNVILGIGLNVNMEANALKSLDQAATSLKVEAEKSFEIESIIDDLTREFNQDLSKYKDVGFKGFLKEYESLLAFSKGLLTFYSHEGTFEGTFDSITEEGFMKLRLTNGEIKTLISGDVSKKAID